jgi:hypothetical protein
VGRLCGTGVEASRVPLHRRLQTRLRLIGHLGVGPHECRDLNPHWGRVDGRPARTGIAADAELSSAAAYYRPIPAVWKLFR